MSIRVMSYVWDNSQYKGASLLLLLAIADYANDEGEAWPSIPSLSRKIRMSERYTRDLLETLCSLEGGELSKKVGRGLGHSNHYYFTHYYFTRYLPKQEAGLLLSGKAKQEAGLQETGGGPPRNRRRASEKQEAGLPQPIINRQLTTTDPPEDGDQEEIVVVREAAAAVVDGKWVLEGLLEKVKPSWKKLVSKSTDPRMFVANFLYATTQPTWKYPAYYAAKNCSGPAGEPFDGLAMSGPEQVALAALWLSGRDELYGQLNGTAGLALAWRGMLHKNVSPESVCSKVLNELGLSAYRPAIVQPETATTVVEKSITPLDDLTRTMRANKAPEAIIQRLEWSKFISSDDAYITISARAHDAVLIQRAMSSVIQRYLGDRELVVEVKDASD